MRRLLADWFSGRAGVRTEKSDSRSLPPHAPAADLMLCHSAADKTEVRILAMALRDRGVEPWLDEDRLPYGLPWQDELEYALQTVPAVAILFGRHGEGPWEREERRVALQEAVDRGKPVIPILLPGCAAEVTLPPFLKGRTIVDFRAGYKEAVLDRLHAQLGSRRASGAPREPSAAHDAGGDAHDPVRHHYLQAVVRWLGTAGVAEVLVGILALPDRTNLEMLARRLALLAEADVEELACLLAVADKRWSTAEGRSLAAIKEHPMSRIYDALLPCAERTRAREASGNVVEAEARRAALDARPTEWKGHHELILIGARAIPHGPEFGMNPGRDVEGVVTYLACRFRERDGFGSPTDDQPYAEGTAYTETLVADVRDRIELDQRRWKYREEGSHPYYAIVHSEALRAALKRRLPSLEVVLLPPRDPEQGSTLVKAVWELIHRRRWQREHG